MVMGILTIVCKAFAPQIVGLLTHYAEVVAASVPVLRIGVAGIAFIAPNVMFAATFRGLSMGKTTLWLGLTRQFLVFVPLCMFEHVRSLAGAQVAMPASNTLVFLISFAFVYYVHRHRTQASNATMQREGEILRRREDVSRPCALQKLIGKVTCGPGGNMCRVCSAGWRPCSAS